MKAFIILIWGLVFGIILNTQEAYAQDSLKFPPRPEIPISYFFFKGHKMPTRLSMN